MIRDINWNGNLIDYGTDPLDFNLSPIYQLSCFEDKKTFPGEETSISSSAYDIKRGFREDILDGLEGGE